MKKNKRLDKLVDAAIEYSIKGDVVDEKKASDVVKELKKLPLEEAIYALEHFRHGLNDFIKRHTLTIYAPIELPKETVSSITTKFKKEFTITGTEVKIDPSLLAGFTFKIGDTVYDASLLSSLKQLGS